MKKFRNPLGLAAAGAVVLYLVGTAVAGAGAPPKADKPCPGCPQATADAPAAPAMMDRMKAHLDGMKSAVAALRESEKALAGTEDPKAFRQAVIGHLKALDDLQASHLSHMESMMGRMHGGRPGMDCGKCPDCKCRECKCKDCMQKDDCRCRCDCRAEAGHDH